MRLGSENTKPSPAVTFTSTTLPQVDKKPVVCFSCHEIGHKSPQCPKRQKGTVKRIKFPVDCVKSLGKNEVMAEVSGTLIPVR